MLSTLSHYSINLLNSLKSNWINVFIYNNIIKIFDYINYNVVYMTEVLKYGVLLIGQIFINICHYF